MSIKTVDTRFNDAAEDFDLDILDGIDAGSTESFDAQYKTIQWVNGDPKYRKNKDMYGQGGFFFPEKIAFDKAVMLANGWAEVTLTHGSSEETSGYFKRDMQIIPIIVREAWNIKSDGENVGLLGFDNSGRYGNILAYRNAKWDGFARAKEFGSPNIRLQVLCLLVGMEEEGPVALTLGGNVARAFYDERATDTVLGDLHKGVMTPANSLREDKIKERASAAQNEAEKRQIQAALAKKYPMRAFKFSVGSARDEKGDPVYTTVGKAPNTSDITLPMALGLPQRGDIFTLSDWFVGASVFALANEVFDDAKHTWAVAWDALVPAEGAALAKPVTAQRVSAAEAEAQGF